MPETEPLSRARVLCRRKWTRIGCLTSWIGSRRVRRTVFDISEEDKRLYREVLFPYWEKRSMKDFINGQMTDEVKAAVSTQIF